MRMLKLQMQTSLDGFVGGPNGELDWIELNDDKARADVISLAESSDTILMGRKMTEGFVDYWTKAVEKPDEPWYPLAKMMVDYPKTVFTKTLDQSPWPNCVLAKGDIVDEVNRLKKEGNRDIIAYGGAGFAASLIANNLIDEYYFFINPIALGEGLPIFNKISGNLKLKKIDTIEYPSGLILQSYSPAAAKGASTT